MKNKKLFVVVLLVVLCVSLFFGVLNFIRADNAPQLAIVLDGSTTNSVIPTQSVGTSFTVDVYISNTGSVSPSINSVNCEVSWDSSVLTCTDQEDGTYLPHQISADVPLGSNAVLFNLETLYASQPTAGAAPGSSGIVGTLTFQVLSAGSCAISIQLAPGVTYFLTYPSSAGAAIPITDVTSVDAQYGTPNATPTPTTSPTASPTPGSSPTPSPTPTPTSSITAPTAVISIQNDSAYQTGSQIVLDGSSSIAGKDASSACPITYWAWLVQYQNDTNFGAYSGEAVSIFVNSPTTLKITLVITAPDTNSEPNSQYTNTSTTSVWINVELPQQLTKIDVFTNNGGIGQNATSGAFSPQQLVQVYANVTYNGAPVANVNVAFTVFSPNGTIIAIRSAFTNSTGYATIEYQTPWLDNNTADFGIWSILGSVEVSSVYLTDTTYYEYNYVVTTNGITLPASVSRLSPITINVTLGNTNNAPASAIVAITVYDQAEVPINTYITNLSSVKNNLVSDTFTIPSWAFVGTATVYVNILTASPTAGGVPCCPEQTATFQILP